MYPIIITRDKHKYSLSDELVVVPSVKTYDHVKRCTGRDYIAEKLSRTIEKSNERTNEVTNIRSDDRTVGRMNKWMKYT